MNLHWCLWAVVTIIAAAPAEQQSKSRADAVAAADSPLKTLKEKATYSVGVKIGRNLRREMIDLDIAILMKGIKDAMSGGKTLLTDQEIDQVMAEFRKELTTMHAKAGEDFLAANKKKEGVQSTASGLQYKVIKEGKGAKPKATDTVTVHYRGTFIDGTAFDSSYGRGEPTTFAVGRVIPGWTEALQLMPAGSKWQVFIPSKLAYGEEGAGDAIGPNATLIFEIELLSIGK